MKKQSKACSHCGKKKAISSYYASGISRDGLDYYCKPCRDNLNEERRKEKLDKQRFHEEARALGYSIKLLRQCLGLTQAEMADKLDMGRTAYANVESGKVKIRRDAALILQKLAQRVTTPQYFLWIPMSLRELRVNLGLTREEVAEHLGVDAGTWGRWETGKSAPVDRQAVLKEIGELAGETIKRRVGQLPRSEHVF